MKEEIIIRDGFEYFMDHIKNIRQSFPQQRRLIQLSIFRYLTSQDFEIRPDQFENFQDDIDFASEHGYLNPDLSPSWEYGDNPFHENPDMMILTESLHEVKRVMESGLTDDFKIRFREEFDAPLDFNHRMFWTNVLGTGIEIPS